MSCGEEADSVLKKDTVKYSVIRGLSLSLSRHNAQPSCPKRNLGDLEKILWHTFCSELRVAPEENQVLVTEALMTDKRTREETMEVLFNTFGIAAVMFAPQELLTTCAYGKESGIVVNVGESYTSIVPVCSMKMVRHAARVLPVGGRDVTEALRMMLLQEPRVTDRIYCPEDDINRSIVEDIKKKHAYIPADYDLEKLKPVKLKKFEFPDCQEVELGQELFRCTECLFAPELFGIEALGISEALCGVIGGLSDELKIGVLNQGVYLTGASTMFTGFKDKLERDVHEQYPELKVKVIAAPERPLSTWIGGSIWASFTLTKDLWTTKEDYIAHGASGVHNRCL